MKVVYKLISALLICSLLISGFIMGAFCNNAIITVQAASKIISKKALQKQYISWLDTYGYHYGSDDNDYTKAKIVYVDLDGDGINEMIYSSYAFGHVMLSYDKSRNSVKKLKEMSTGKGGFAYCNKKKGMVSFSNSSTGNMDTYFYKYRSNKLKKIKVIRALRVDKETENGYERHWEYAVDGKQVGEKQYRKVIKSALKGYQKVTPMADNI